VLDIRRRTGFLFLAVSIGHIILISAQVNTKSGVRVLEAVTFGIFSQVQRGTASGIGSVQHVWENYVALRGVAQQNEQLRRQVAALQIELQKQQALSARAQQLQDLLQLRNQLELETVPAQIIAGDTTLEFHTVTIDKGASDGIGIDMAVIAPEGIVGRIVKTGARASIVQLLLDSDAAAAALIEGSRVGGLVVGRRGDPPLQMEYVSNLENVKRGDIAVTSGLDRIYPKGFRIGRVEEVQPGENLYKAITIRPSVDFSRLEEVLVVTTPPFPPVDEAPR
jgi:rod shape-determining protein MreC